MIELPVMGTLNCPFGIARFCVFPEYPSLYFRTFYRFDSNSSAIALENQRSIIEYIEYTDARLQLQFVAGFMYNHIQLFSAFAIVSKVFLFVAYFLADKK